MLDVKNMRAGCSIAEKGHRYVKVIQMPCCMEIRLM